MSGPVACQDIYLKSSIEEKSRVAWLKQLGILARRVRRPAARRLRLGDPGPVHLLQVVAGERRHLEGCGFAYLCTASVDETTEWLKAAGIPIDNNPTAAMTIRRRAGLLVCFFTT